MKHTIIIPKFRARAARRTLNREIKKMAGKFPIGCPLFLVSIGNVFHYFDNQKEAEKFRDKNLPGGKVLYKSPEEWSQIREAAGVLSQGNNS